MRESMVNIRIQNVGGQAVGASSGVPLPPPFHMIRLAPGEGEVSFCKVEDLHRQYPYRSGFKVADILQQLIQLGRISVDIQRVGDEARHSKLTEFIGHEAPSPTEKSDVPERKPRRRPEPPAEPPQAPQEALLPDPEDSEVDEYDWPERWPEAQEKKPESEPALGDEMSGQDDLPEMVDPLYNTPPKDKAKKKGRPKKAPEASNSSETSGTGIDLPEDVFVTPPRPRQADPHNDKFSSAMRMAFIGAGQGGGRIVDSFRHLGYNRVCCINTTEQDLKSLEGLTQLVIGNNRGGAGKDPEQGRLAAKESYEDIMDLMMRSWGESVEQMFICIGAGGGSGTGSWPVLVKAAKEYGESTNVEKPISKHLGVIMTMPKRSEGSRVQHNALMALRQAVEMVASKKISTLIILDNAKIHELYPCLLYTSPSPRD